MTSVTVPSCAWYGDKPLELSFPSSWSTALCKMSGHDVPPLSQSEIRDRVAQPIGTRPLRELAGNRKECVIIVDDLTRPTKAWQVIPAVLEELHAGGIDDEHIRFVMAIGAHDFMRLDDLVKKLGEDVPDRFCVYNHNVYENNVALGRTSSGTPVSINREVMRCDLKVAIGCILPHMSAGWGGGGKIILPGVASIDTITHNHKDLKIGTGEGRIEGNVLRADAEEVARMAGLDFIANAVLNSERDCCGLVCGDMVQAQREGVRIGRKHYATRVEPNVDIAVVNGYPMESEAYKALELGAESVRDGGDVVILLYAPNGARGHYYNGRFGTDYGGRGWSPDVYWRKHWRMKRVIAVSPYHSKADESYYGTGSVWVKTWQDALKELESIHSGKARLAVYPCASIQISEKNAALP